MARRSCQTLDPMNTHRAAFSFENTKRVISNAEMLEDLCAVAAKLESSALPQQRYRTEGRFSTTAVKRRFGSWNAAVIAAGLSVAGERNVSEAELFANLGAMWEHLGRQPRKREMVKPFSRYTHHPYVERYGGWLGTVQAFLSSHVESSAKGAPIEIPAARGPRDPSLRLRFLVLRRDGFRCRQCGASPANTPGVELHIDHTIAWASGGTTTVENLQTLCSNCNLGKSNLPHVV